MYLYFLSKKIQDKSVLWGTTKSKYNRLMSELLLSLEEYIRTSGKANCDERILTAILLLESLPTLPFFDQKSTPKSLKKDSYGKPYFDGADIKISIAHNENFVLVAYDENAEIGVDIEGKISTKKAENLAERFPQISSLKIDAEDEKISTFLMSRKGYFESINLTPADDGFTTKWTAAEAIMKCDGRGFSALPEIEKLAENMKISNLAFESETTKEYISVAIKK